jgi:signal transduction histidine kinase
VLALLVGGVAVATVMLLAVGYVAIDGWRRSGARLTERRANEKATLLGVALDRDMKGVQASVLPQIATRRLAFTTPYDLADLFATAFARFPYPESFFVWRRENGAGSGQWYVFNRNDRPPVWDVAPLVPSRYPVIVQTNPDILTPFLRTMIAGDATEPFRLHEIVIAGERYQAVVSLFYDGLGERAVVGAAGFLVNLSWVRNYYFSELTRQIASVVGDPNMALAILDDTGRLVTSTRPLQSDDRLSDRTFPLVFIDRALLAAQPRTGAGVKYWTARASADPDADALPGSWYGLWWLMTCAAAAALVGVVMVGRTLRITAELAEMKSEFVSTVTHDLKTPLALIRLVGETLGLGRYSSPESIRTYARLLSTEAARLTLRIDNLLSYARLTDAQDRYHFENVDLLDTVQESLRRAAPRLSELGFTLDSNLTDAPTVRGDRLALLQVLDNLIDNAIKYSGNARVIEVGTAADAVTAFVSIHDGGIGIPDDEKVQVFEKFYRGRNAGPAGSGLGLAIVKRVIDDHGGSVHVTNGASGGTTITIGIPRSERS